MYVADNKWVLVPPILAGEGFAGRSAISGGSVASVSGRFDGFRGHRFRPTISGVSGATVSG